MRAISATATRQADGRYEVDLLVSARKIRADGGNESELPFDTTVDIGELDKDGNALRLERRLLHTGESHIKLTVAGEPARAGIDPMGKLIDRDAGDNTVAVSR